MARVLIIHAERSARKQLEALIGKHHESIAVSDMRGGRKAMAKQRPGVAVLGMNGKHMDAIEFLREQQGQQRRIPAVVVASAEAGKYQQYVMKMGASAFVEYPPEGDELDRAVATALSAEYERKGGQPPITKEELNTNLSELEAELNRHMKCFAGKNQVYLQSFVRGYDKVSKPRIALKCPLRKQYGESPNVYYEYIRDVCCGDPTACAAHRQFQERHSA